MDTGTWRKLEFIGNLADATCNGKRTIKPVSELLCSITKHSLLAARMKFKEDKVTFINSTSHRLESANCFIRLEA